MDDTLDRHDVKKKIIESIIATKESKREHAFDIFIDGSISNIAVGNEYSVSTDNEDRGRELKGAFHTHSILSKNGDIAPSPADIKTGVNGAKKGLKFFCVGANIKMPTKSAIVRCFDTSKLKSEVENAHNGLGLDDIDKSSRLIASKMVHDKNYLDRLSTKKVY